MGIISGLESFQGQFGDHFRVRDHFGLGIISGAVHIVHKFGGDSVGAFEVTGGQIP